MQKAFIIIIAFGMLISGSVNSIFTNYSDKQSALGTMAPSTIWGKLNNEVERMHLFDHPFYQAIAMFIGEALCMVAHLISSRSARAREPSLIMPEEAAAGAPRSPWAGSFWFAIPAMLDMTGTGTMYAGLCLSYVSVYQMLRGSVIIFTCTISVVFLKRKIYGFQWFAVLMVVIGVTVVGYVSMSNSSGGGKDSTSVLVGNILIVVAQVFVAIQMNIEERLTKVYPMPALQIVGLEGIFGCIMLCLACVPMYFIHVNGYPIENVPDALVQTEENSGILLGLLGTICSIAFFNYFGISVTQKLSCSHRMVLDSVRTLTVWAVSLIIGWESFHWLQLLGFVILTIGTMIYMDVFRLPLFYYPPAEEVAASETPHKTGGSQATTSQNSAGAVDAGAMA